MALQIVRGASAYDRPEQLSLSLPFAELATTGKAVQDRSDLAQANMEKFGATMASADVRAEDKPIVNKFYQDYANEVSQLIPTNGNFSDPIVMAKIKQIQFKYANNPTIATLVQNKAVTDQAMKQMSGLDFVPDAEDVMLNLRPGQSSMNPDGSFVNAQFTGVAKPVDIEQGYRLGLGEIAKTSTEGITQDPTTKLWITNKNTAATEEDFKAAHAAFENTFHDSAEGQKIIRRGQSQGLDGEAYFKQNYDAMGAAEWARQRGNIQEIGVISNQGDVLGGNKDNTPYDLVKYDQIINTLNQSPTESTNTDAKTQAALQLGTPNKDGISYNKNVSPDTPVYIQIGKGAMNGEEAEEQIKVHKYIELKAKEKEFQNKVERVAKYGNADAQDYTPLRNILEEAEAEGISLEDVDLANKAKELVGDKSDPLLNTFSTTIKGLTGNQTFIPTADENIFKDINGDLITKQTLVLSESQLDALPGMDSKTFFGSKRTITPNTGWMKIMDDHPDMIKDSGKLQEGTDEKLYNITTYMKVKGDAADMSIRVQDAEYGANNIPEWYAKNRLGISQHSAELTRAYKEKAKVESNLVSEFRTSPKEATSSWLSEIDSIANSQSLKNILTPEQQKQVQDEILEISNLKENTEKEKRDKAKSMARLKLDLIDISKSSQSLGKQTPQSNNSNPLGIK